jgi:hypothetical protein
VLHIPASHPARALAVLVLTAALALPLTACSTDEPAASDEATQLSDFRARAATGASGAWTATYDLTQTTGDDAVVQVAHTGTSVRLDIDSGATTSTSITTPDGVVACLKPTNGTTRCLDAADAGETPPPALDPGLRTVLSESLAKLGQGYGTVEIIALQPNVDAAAICARVTGEDVAQGVYCLLEDGVPAFAKFRSGSITLTQQGAAPAADAFVPPATPKPSL